MKKPIHEQLTDDDVAQGPTTATGPKQNYITPAGLQKLKDEYHQLFHQERPKLVEVIAWAASNGDRSENGDYIYGKRRLREIDRRLKFLGRRLASAIVVSTSPKDPNTVAFGAKVTAEDDSGQAFIYHIVGEDEIDLERRMISWVSPVGQALLGAKLGDEVTVQRPNGQTILTLIKIEYPSSPGQTEPGQ